LVVSTAVMPFPDPGGDSGFVLLRRVHSAELAEQPEHVQLSPSRYAQTIPHDVYGDAVAPPYVR
jgi:hypothetical protein